MAAPNTQTTLKCSRILILCRTQTGPSLVHGKPPTQSWSPLIIVCLYHLTPFKGFCSSYCADIHIKPIHKDYSLVFWGGTANEMAHSWSFQIVKRRSNQKTFDENLDTPVNLHSAGLRVSVAQLSPDPIQLKNGRLIVHEGGAIFVEHQYWKVPIIFPKRARPERDYLPHVFFSLSINCRKTRFFCSCTICKKFHSNHSFSRIRDPLASVKSDVGRIASHLIRAGKLSPSNPQT